MSFNTLLFISLIASTFSSHAMSAKPKPVKNAKQNSAKMVGKSLGYFQTILWSEDNGNGDLTIKAKVVARHDMPQAEFQWKTPEGIDILSGDATGSSSIAAGEDKLFSIVVDKAKLKDQDQFFFFVYETKNGERHGSSQSYIHNPNDVSKSQQKSKKEKPPKYFE